jgi:hypothetical protein
MKKPEYIQTREHPSFHEIRRFLEHEIARTLPGFYPEWDAGAIDSCTIKICPEGYEYRLMPCLWNFATNFFALKSLCALGLDTPCHTFGDIASEKFGLIPIESIRRYGETHKNQILNWLASTPYNNTLLSNTYAARLERAFAAAARGHNGGAI